VIAVEIQTDAVLFARFGLAAVFFVAGAAKLSDLAGSRHAIVSFGLPKSLAPPLGAALPVIELVVAFALIPATSAQWGAIAALVLLALFVAGIANVMLRRREAECHCFGQLHSSRVGWPTLIRNLALALVAVYVIVPARDVSPGYMERIAELSRADLIALLVGTMALAILCAGGWFMMHLLRQHGRLLLRLDALEEQLAARGIIAHPAGAADGLAPGVTAPAFVLPDLNGNSTALDDLLSAGLPLLLVFSHPSCTPCAAMLPQMRVWQSANESDLTIAFISQGSVDDNRAAVADHGIAHILVQREREIADAYEAYATPSAVLISPEGIIASPVVQGEPAIGLLITSAASAARSDMGSSTSDNDGVDSSRARLRSRDRATASIPVMGLDAS